MKDGLEKLVARLKKKGGRSDDHLSDLEAPAEDLIDAVKAGDASRVARALKDAYDVCSSQAPEEPSDEDEDYDSGFDDEEDEV